MKLFIFLPIFLLFISLQSFAQSTKPTGNQIEFGDSNVFDNSNIAGGDINLTNNYLGLDSAQIQKINELQVSIDILVEQIGTLTQHISSDQTYQDSVMRVSIEMGYYQRQIAELKRINDSIINSIDKDSLVLKKLQERYDVKLDSELGKFWKSYPQINPLSNKSWIEFAESQGVQVSDILNTASSHYLDYRRCNGCVRESKGNDWLGVTAGGVNYYFSGTGVHTISGWQGKNIGALSINIPGYGAKTIFELREHYQNYYDLMKRRKDYINAQYAKYLQNPEVSIEEIINPTIPCEKAVGDFIVSNHLGQELRIWLCEHNNSNCEERSGIYHMIIPAGKKGTFYEVPEGIYNYNSKRGSGLVYPGPKGQMRIVKCTNESLVIP